MCVTPCVITHKNFRSSTQCVNHYHIAAGPYTTLPLYHFGRAWVGSLATRRFYCLCPLLPSQLPVWPRLQPVKLPCCLDLHRERGQRYWSFESMPCFSHWTKTQWRLWDGGMLRVNVAYHSSVSLLELYLYASLRQSDSTLLSWYSTRCYSSNQDISECLWILLVLTFSYYVEHFAQTY